MKERREAHYTLARLHLSRCNLTKAAAAFNSVARPRTYALAFQPKSRPLDAIQTVHTYNIYMYAQKLLCVTQ